MIRASAAELEALGAAAAADTIEALDPEALHYEPTGELAPELAFRHEAHERELARADR